ncbi:MAG: hypothetical protein NTU84_03185, partial [Verrucomicrobia bacterium]|nr:hypothetical protein [Verrucomicrobiota bacterium]
AKDEGECESRSRLMSGRPLQSGCTMSSALWKIINRDAPGRTDGQIPGEKTKSFLTDKNGTGVEMLVHRDLIVKIIPSGIGCGHGEAPRAFDFRDALQRPLKVLHQLLISGKY